MSLCIGESKKNAKLFLFNIMPETSKPNESPRFPAADDESFLLKVAERLVEDSKSQFIIPSEVNSLKNENCRYIVSILCSIGDNYV